jgi:3-hydroxyisobutyrate dehydrogenase
MSAIKKIGFIGIGNMGSPMASHLIKKGFDVTVYDARPEVMQAFVAQHGGKAAKSLVDAAHGMDAVITRRPDDKVVRKVVLGDGSENCIAAGLAKGAIVMDMGTSNPSGTRSLAEALKPRGIEVVDAPVMGGVVFAKDATLDVMVGGDAALIARVTPVLQAIGRSIIPCGGTGTAHALKAIANYINATALINAVEAMTIGRKFGLDSKLMADALIPMCAERNHPILKKVVPHVLTRKFSTGMAMAFIAKDLKISVDMAHSMGAAVPLGEKVHELWAAAAEKLGGNLDQTEVAKYWEEATGVKL